MQMETRRTRELRPHQASLEIYGKNEDIADLAASIRANGVLVPLTVRPDGTILSGNRRYRAALQAGLEEVPCVTAEPKTPEEEEIFIIEANRNRKKDVYQLYNEGVRLKAAYEVLARRRKATRANESTEGSENGSRLVPANLAVSKMEKPAGYEKGQASAAIASAIGMKDRTWQRLDYIAGLANIGNETAAELLARINSEDLSISKAEKILRQSLKAQTAAGEPEREKTLLEICTEQAEKNANSLLRALEKIIATPDGEFNSLLCDPLRDRLRFVGPAIARLDEKAKACRAKAAAKTENGKEHAA